MTTHTACLAMAVIAKVRDDYAKHGIDVNAYDAAIREIAETLDYPNSALRDFTNVPRHRALVRAA